MDDLTRTQMIMLVLLTSFITSMATGIVTVSLMEQAPTPLTQTVHKVIEKITTIDNSGNNQMVASLFAPEKTPPTREERIVKVISDISPAVVSIVASKDLPIIEEFFVNPFQKDDLLKNFPGLIPDIQIPQYRSKGIERKQISSGTGFFISKEGLLLTNKHVVVDEEADYSIVMNDGKRLEAVVIARDPFQDIAILEVKHEEVEGEESSKEEFNFKFIPLGNSDKLKSGQSVIAIGNALGEFRNTVSVGIVSGLHRNVIAEGGASGSEQLQGLIQTDAAINPGNSGGPLLDLYGRVIGINTAVAKLAENVGFALPINIAKRDINDAIKFGEIKYPYLGVRYKFVPNGLEIVVGPKGEPAVLKDSPAEKAGLKEGDIILELDRLEITPQNNMSLILSKRNVGDEIEAKILRGEEEMMIQILLGERPEGL